MKILNKINNDKIVKNLSLIISILLVIIFLSIVIFIGIYSYKGFKNIGINNILFTGEFNLSINKYSFWLPFSITLLTSTLSIVIAAPLGIKTATFIHFRINKKYKKFFRIFFEILSGIPSVMFGLFAYNSLGKIFSFMNISSFSIINGSIMLSFMVLPTIIAMTLNSLDGVNINLLTNPIALGNTKTSAIYKVYKKAAMPGIIISIILAFTRSIGESMAISIILQSSPNTNDWNQGVNILGSSVQTIGSFISTNMFIDTDPEKIRPLLYVFGLMMFIISMLMNIILLVLINKKRNKKSMRISKIENNIYLFLTYIPRNMALLFEKISFKSKYNPKLYEEALLYVKDRSTNYKFFSTYSYWKIFWEYFAVIICSSFLFWIVGDIFFNGIIGIKNSNTIFTLGKISVGQSLINTILIIILAILISFPFSIAIAIYLNEYSKDNFFKKIIIFFMDSLSSTPSIIFGMFGMIFFIEVLGLTSSGNTGNSLLAGVFTISIVILPNFIRILQQSLNVVPNEYRLNSYALGNTKLQTIRKIILPSAINGIITAFVLIIGRILSETAPLYLTAGLSSSWDINYLRSGTTLTTLIYSQKFVSDYNGIHIQYEAAFVTILFVIIIVLSSYILIPNWYKIKQHIRILKDKFMHKYKINKNLWRII